MGHRIREAMRVGGLAPMGGEGETVEIDETFIGQKQDVPKAKGGWKHKSVVLTLVQRGGSARSFHVESTRKEHVMPIIRENIARETAVQSDEAVQYKKLAEDFESHGMVRHGTTNMSTATA